jgi:hypothetical protein
MPTLNRFPLLGLWAEEAARRLGYTAGEAESLGHAYAVLYAIRARGKPHHPPAAEKKPPARKAARRPRTEPLEFGGDRLDVTRDAKGRVRGLVGGAAPQTPESYHHAVEEKFPPGWHDRLESAFRRLLRTYRPSELNSRLVYDLYDEWKKSCAVGRSVDLECLLKWCNERASSRR